MTCVYKEYEVKTKMVLKQLFQLKMKFSLGYNMEIVIQWGRNKPLVSGRNLIGGLYWGGFFQVRRRMKKISASRGTLPLYPLSSPLWKILQSPHRKFKIYQPPPLPAASNPPKKTCCPPPKKTMKKYLYTSPK